MGIVRQMIQQDTPPAAVAKALAGLDEAINGQVPPVWIEPMEHRGGYCEWNGGAEGEIRISDTLAGVRFDPDSTSRPHHIRNTVIHECAHRLVGPCGSTGHNGAFLAMHLTLSFRANNLERDTDWPDWHSVCLYDVHDHHQDSLITMTQALAWAWAIAQELAPTASTTEECAAIIKSRWKKFTDAQEHRAERIEAKKAQQKQAFSDAEAEADRVANTHRNDKLFLSFIALIGWSVAIIVVMTHAH